MRILTRELINQLLEQKCLIPNIFEKQGSQKIPASLLEHNQWLFNNIYSKPYPNTILTDIARPIHGIQHVSRVALYTNVFANLYLKHGNIEAVSLTEENLLILQLGALFHDAAREDEGIDRWDDESAIFFYLYLTQVLDITHEKAKIFAEAVGNKDVDPRGYFEINFDANTRETTYGYNSAITTHNKTL